MKLQARILMIVLVGAALWLSAGAALAQQQFDGIYIINCSGCGATTVIGVAAQVSGVFGAALLYPGEDPDWEVVIVSNLNLTTGQGSGIILNSSLVNIGTINFTISGSTGSFATSLGTSGTFNRIFP